MVRLVRIVIKFLQLSLRDKLLLAEVVFFLILSELIIFFLPFRLIVKILGEKNVDSPSMLDYQRERMSYLLSKFIKIGSKNIPWNSKCLAQAIAGKLMLRLRGLPGTVYFGVTNSKIKIMDAHAWLRSGKIHVTGGNGNGFNLLVKFS